MSWYRALLGLFGLTSNTGVHRLPTQPGSPADSQVLDPATSALAQAGELLTAIDRGGIPLSPIIVNRIARNLGLEVATTDLMPDTIERIRHYIDAQGLTP